MQNMMKLSVVAASALSGAAAFAAPSLFALPGGIEVDAAVSDVAVLNADGSNLILPGVSINSFSLPYSERAETVASGFTNAGTGSLNAFTDMAGSLTVSELFITAESSVSFEVPGSVSPFVQVSSSGFSAGTFFVTEDVNGFIELTGEGQFEIQIERLGAGGGVIARIDEDTDPSLMESFALLAGEYSFVFEVRAGVNGGPFSGTRTSSGSMRLVIPTPGVAAGFGLFGAAMGLRRRR
jgi:hypothetical protein